MWTLSPAAKLIPALPQRRWERLLIVPCVATTALVSSVSAYWLFRPTPTPTKPVRQTLLEVIPAHIDLGTVPPGSRHSRTVVIRNPTSQAVEIAYVNSSCPCATLEISEKKLPPGESVSCMLCVDFAAEHIKTPASLRLDLTVHSPGGRAVAAVVCDVIIK